MQWFGGFDVCTVGSGTRDVFIQSSHFEQKADRNAPAGFDACFPMGAKIPLDNVVLDTGGGATNAAFTFRRMGFRTACICRVGNDDHGKTVVDALNQAGINLRGIQYDPKHKTSYSVILLSGIGERSILVYRGAANYLVPTQIPWKRLKCKWIYLTSLGGEFKSIKQIFSTVNTFHGQVAWNPGGNEIRLGLNKLRPLIKKTQILLLNREEAALLSEQAPRHLDRIVAVLGKLPRAALVITDGPKGAYVFDSQTKKLLFGPALGGKPVNTTGAGDAFGSGFVSAYIKTHDINKSLRLGLLNGHHVVMEMGAKHGLLPAYPTEHELKNIPIKQITL